MNNYLFTQNRYFSQGFVSIEFKRSFVIAAENAEIAQREMSKFILENFDFFDRESDDVSKEFLDNISALKAMKSDDFERSWEAYQEELEEWEALKEDDSWSEDYKTFEEYVSDKPKLLLSDATDDDIKFIIKYFDSIEMDEIPFDESGEVVFGENSDCNTGDIPTAQLISPEVAKLLIESGILDDHW